MSREVAEVLQKALAAFGPNGEHWIKGEGALDADGRNIITHLDGVAVSWCSAGSIIWHEAKGKQHFSDSEAYKALEAMVGAPIYLWNDAPERTFADVRAVFEKAIKEQESGIRLRENEDGGEE